MEFIELWREYSHQLRQFLLARVNNPSDVDDLLQEILIKTYRHLNTVKDPDKLPAWLFQIARNLLIDYYRKVQTDASRQELAARALLTDGEPEPYEQVRQDLTHCLRPFLSQLPDKYRAAIEAVDLAGASQKELAMRLGLSHSAVKSRVQRGRKLLKALFQECCRYELDARGNLVDYEAIASRCQGC